MQLLDYATAALECVVTFQEALFLEKLSRSSCISFFYGQRQELCQFMLKEGKGPRSQGPKVQNLTLPVNQQGFRQHTPTQLTRKEKDREEQKGIKEKKKDK